MRTQTGSRARIRARKDDIKLKNGKLGDNRMQSIGEWWILELSISFFPCGVNIVFVVRLTVEIVSGSIWRGLAWISRWRCMRIDYIPALEYLLGDCT